MCQKERMFSAFPILITTNVTWSLPISDKIVS